MCTAIYMQLMKKIIFWIQYSVLFKKNSLYSISSVATTIEITTTIEIIISIVVENEFQT